jgi:hypothetical protein
MLRDQLLRQVVVELARLHPPNTLRSKAMQDRYSLPPDVAAALERARLQVEALAQTADELQVVLPDAVGSALRDGLREEAAPISRRLAEVKGLSNQMIRRLERIETDLLAERHARVDDLSLLVELITSEWRGLNERLDRIEHALEPRADVVQLRPPATG